MEYNKSDTKKAKVKPIAGKAVKVNVEGIEINTSKTNKKTELQV